VVILKWRQEKRILEVDVDSEKFLWGTFVTTVISHAARVGEGRGVYGVLVVKPEGKRPLGRPKPRWEDNIKMNLQEVG